jgi:hypothetical protein
MSGQNFTMRRDTRKHAPPRPAPRPGAARAEPPRVPQRAAPSFWREEERRHTPRSVPLSSRDGRHGG